MPKVPVSNRQVNAQRFQSRGVSTKMAKRASNAGALQQAGNIVETVYNYAEQEKNRVNTIELDAFKTRLRKKQDELIHNKDSGFYTVKGKNTTGSYDAYKDDFSSFSDTELEKLGSDELKQKASLSVERFKLDVKRQLDGHTSREMEAYDDKQTQVNLDAIIDHTALNYRENGLVASKVKEAQVEQAKIISDYAERKGLSSEQKKDLELNSSSRLHFSVANQMINGGDSSQAKEYVKAQNEKGQIDEATNLRLDKMLKSSGVKQESQLQADKIMREQETLEGVLEQARSIEDPEVRDATVSRVRNRWNEKKLIKEETDKAVFNDIVNQIDNFKTIDHLPEQEKLTMSKKQKAVVESMLGMISKGYNPDTNPEVYQDLMLEASVNHQKFMRRDINLSAHKLSKTDRQSFLRIQSSLRKGDGKHDEELGNFLSHAQQISNSLKEHGVTEDKEKANFQTHVMKKAVKWQKDNGSKKIPDAELQDIIDKALTPIEIEGATWFNNPDKRVFQLEQGDKITDFKGKSISDLTYDDIPEVDKSRMLRVFKKQGYLNPSEDQVAKAYQRYLKQ